MANRLSHFASLAGAAGFLLAALVACDATALPAAPTPIAATATASPIGGAPATLSPVSRGLPTAVPTPIPKLPAPGLTIVPTLPPPPALLPTNTPVPSPTPSPTRTAVPTVAAPADLTGWL